MKVNSNRDISFKGFCNNKPIKRVFEFAGKDPALFTATTTLALSLFARPVAVALAPNTDKENKIIAMGKSVTSSLLQFALTYALSTPIVNALEKIDKTPEKYLKPKTIKEFKKGCVNLEKSKRYLFATQVLKLGVGATVAIPKGMLTAFCMPFVLDKVFHYKKPTETEHVNDNDNYLKNESTPTFKAKTNERIAKKIGQVLNKEGVQKFANKHKDSNFVMHMIAGTDTLTTATFIHQTYVSHDIPDKKKKALIYNAGFSTAISIISSYILDSCSGKSTEKFIEYYKKVNLKDPNLDKQVKGIKIAKPILLVGCVYYMLIPFISTILAEIADHNPKLDLPKRNKNNNICYIR